MIKVGMIRFDELARVIDAARKVQQQSNNSADFTAGFELALEAIETGAGIIRYEPKREVTK